MRVFTDFDGPIMDVSERYYRVYRFCVQRLAQPHLQLHRLSKDEFWQAKRDRVPEREIALRTGFPSHLVDQFVELRQAHVHSAPFFGYDQLQADAHSALNYLVSHGIELATMTMRRHKELQPVLIAHKLDVYFPRSHRYCLTDNYRKTDDVTDKTNLMAQALAVLPPASQIWMIGDTEADIIAGRKNNVPTIAITGGIRSRQALQPYQPSLILPNLTAAAQHIVANLKLLGMLPTR